MNERDRIPPTELRGPILRAVSRSFYISIHFLPRRLRQPVGLAYLLARATDTVADTAQIPALVRAQMLADLSSVVQGEVSPDAVADLVNLFAPLQRNEAERQLIESLPNCLEELARASSDDRDDIRSVLQKI